jgi:DNA-directed RNA polymerase subunit H (RpoH/RPB5)
MHGLARIRVMNQPAHADTRAVSALKCELAGEVLRSFGKLRFAATGWSMLPTLWPRETLVVERVTHAQVQLGDVVLITRDGKLCAHRVVSIEAASAIDGLESRLITQGDALQGPDQPVIENELLGRVAYVIRGGKCIPIPAELDIVKSVVAKVIRRSPSAARALVYLNRMRHI